MSETAARAFERVCAATDLAPGELRGVVLAGGARVCLAMHGGAVHAVSDRCPHQQFPLSDGEIDAAGAIVCSWHGAAFDCRTGRAVRGPLRGGRAREEPLGRLTVFEVQIADGDVWVRPAPESF